MATYHICVKKASMRIPLPVHLLVLCSVSCCSLLGETLHIDLRQRGYLPPPRQYRKGYETIGALLTGMRRYLDFDAQDDAVAGFVIRNAQNQLSTLDSPALTWHAVRFDQGGRYLSETTVPTRSWNDNGLFSGDEETLLLRTGNDLALFSANGGLVGRRIIPKDHWIRILPSRRAFVLSWTWGGRIEVVDMRTLVTVSECGSNDKNLTDSVLSVSDNCSMTYGPSLSGDTHVQQIRVNQRCGPLEYAFDTTRGSRDFSSSLLDDRTVMSPGTGWVVVQDRGVERWRDSSYSKNELVRGDIRMDLRGTVVAVLAERFTGGSRLLDLDGHINKVRIIVYRVLDGKRLAEVPIAPLPLSVFDFAISGDGKRLGVLSDGDLAIFSIPAA